MPETIAFIATGASLFGGASVIASTALYYGVSTAIYGGLSLGAQYLGQAFVDKPQGPRPSDIKTNIKEAVAWRLHSVGIVRVGGPVLFYERFGDNMNKIFATGSGEIDGILAHFIDDKEVALNANGQASERRARIFFRLGQDDQTAYDYLISVFPDIWSSAHRGRGFPHALMVMDQGAMEDFSENWPNGISTTYSQVQRSAKLFDPRTGQTAFSENAALAIRYFLTSPYGMALDPSWVENADDTFRAAAAISDEDVPLKGGGTEKRWRLANTWSMNERRVDVLNRLLAACDGEVFATPNKGIGLRVGQWEEPTVTLDESAIVSVTGLTRGGDPMTRANTIRATYTSRPHKFEEVEADPWTDEADIAARGEEPDSMELYAVPSHAQARRLMKIRHRRLNPRWRGTFVCNLKGLRALGKRFVRIQMSIPPIDETFEIVSPVGFLLSETNTIKGVTFEAVAMSAEAWAWDAQAEEGVEPRVPDDPESVDDDLPKPAGFALVKVEKIVNGTSLPFARFSVTQPTNPNWRVEFEITTIEGETGEIVSHADDTYDAEYGPLEDGKEYSGRARIRTVGGTPGPWTDYLKVRGADELGPVGPVEAVQLSEFNQRIRYSARAPNDPYVGRIEVSRRTGSSGAFVPVSGSPWYRGAGQVVEFEETGAQLTTYTYRAIAMTADGKRPSTPVDRTITVPAPGG